MAFSPRNTASCLLKETGAFPIIFLPSIRPPSCMIPWQWTRYVKGSLQVNIQQYSKRIFHNNFSPWSFTRDWIAASFLRSPGLVSVFWKISTVLNFGWSRFVLKFTTFPAHLPSLEEPFPAHQIWYVSLSSSCSIAFLVLGQAARIRLSSRFLWFLFCGSPGWQSPQFVRISLFHSWSFGRDLVICLYLEISANFVRLVLKKGFWFVHIPFGSIVKFQFLAQFSVDHLHQPVVSSPVLFIS